jgi:hypothetical protein
LGTDLDCFLVHSLSLFVFFSHWNGVLLSSDDEADAVHWIQTATGRAVIDIYILCISYGFDGAARFRVMFSFFS